MRRKNNRRTALAGLMLVATLPLLLAQGCPPQNQNSDPTANAGNDRTVAFGDSVTLNGNGSSDPDNDTLSFSWTQTSGTNVNLTGANTSTPSFTAGNTAETLTFQLTVNDGNGGTDTDSVNVTVTSNNNNAVTPTLFIGSSNTDNVTSYANPFAVNGNIAPDTNLQGAQTQIDFPTGITNDANNALLVANLNFQSITAYDDAFNTNGNLAPNRNVQGAATQIIQPRDPEFYAASDLVFLSDNATNSILVFANASTNAFNGNLAPVRTIVTTTTADINQPRGVEVTSGNILYLANRGNNNVLAFANASTLNGDVTPTRIIQSGFFTDIRDVFVDGNDNLFVVDLGAGNIYTFNNAATLNGNVNPDFTLTVQGANQLRAIVVDSSGTGYIADAGNDAIYSYDNIATLNGTLVPDRTIQGAATLIDNPRSLLLIE